MQNTAGEVLAAQSPREVPRLDQRTRYAASPLRAATRCPAVEPVIGHLKAEHRMGRNHLKGRGGDCADAVLTAPASTSPCRAGWRGSEVIAAHAPSSRPSCNNLAVRPSLLDRLFNRSSLTTTHGIKRSALKSACSLAAGRSSAQQTLAEGDPLRMFRRL